jgi:hypothetical protein
MATLAQQIAALRADLPKDWRAAKSKREQLARLERRLVRRWGRAPQETRELPF